MRILQAHPKFSGTRYGVYFSAGRASFKDPALAQLLCQEFGYEDVTEQLRPDLTELPPIKVPPMKKVNG